MTKLEIANMALLRVGNTVIQSLDQNSTDAMLCNILLIPTVKEVLREGTWSSAAKRVKLALNEAAPEFQYTYSYALPADYIRVIDVYNADGEYLDTNYWQIEGSNLLTDMPEVNLTYVHLPTDFNIFDDLLDSTIVLKLAIRLAPSKTENQQIPIQLLTEYEQITAQRAKSIDAIDSRSESSNNEANWLTSRLMYV